MKNPTVPRISMRLAITAIFCLLNSTILAADMASAPQAQPVVIKGDQPDRSIVYKTIGDTELKLHIFNPENHSENDKRPAIVFFFGGGVVKGHTHPIFSAL